MNSCSYKYKSQFHYSMASYLSLIFNTNHRQLSTPQPPPFSPSFSFPLSFILVSNMENGAATQSGEGKDPSSFLGEIIGNPVTVKLNSGVVYKGKCSIHLLTGDA